MRVNQPLFNRLPLDRSRPQGRFERLDNVPAVITSQAFDWPGLLMEAGDNDIAQVEGMTLAHHYVRLISNAAPVTMEVSEPRGSRSVVQPPGTLCFLPAGDPITLRLSAVFGCIRLTLAPEHLNRLLAPSSDGHGAVEFRRAYTIAAPQLAYLLQALAAEARMGNPGGLAFVEAITAAIGHQLARHAGVEKPRPQPVRGGLSPAARRRTLELIEAKLDARLSIETLAREVGLSPGHFAHAFRDTIGRPPHRYLLSRRLQRARRMLDHPDAVLSQVAHATGFADQAHFTRLFKREFGVTPGAVRRRRTVV